MCATVRVFFRDECGTGLFFFIVVVFSLSGAHVLAQRVSLKMWIAFSANDRTAARLVSLPG